MTFKQDGDYFGSYNNPNIRRRELMRHSPRDADAVPSASMPMSCAGAD